MSGAHRPGLADPRLLALNRHIARRIWLRRQQVGLTQAQLAALIGVAYQMVHKYEQRISRLTAGQLHAKAIALHTEVTFFFEDAEPEPIKTTQQESPRQLVELMDDVLRIANPEYRHVICALAKAMAKRASADDEEG
jgi:transcriptional regulator with XRE-family HTH domain